MNSRDRILAAIHHQLTDRMPIEAISIENQDRLAQFLNIPIEDVLDYLGLDGRIVGVPYTGTLPIDNSGFPFNTWGVMDTGDYGTAHIYPLANVSSIKEIDSYPAPEINLFDFKASADAARILGKKYAVRGPYWEPLFDRVCELTGMERAMILMLTEPILFETLLEKVFQVVFQISEKLLDSCGDDMPIYCLGDDFATQRGLMISPKTWRKYLKPRYRQLFDMAKRKGKHIWFHSCGDITSVLPDLIDIGMDVWETVQLHTLPISPEKLKTEYGGYITFFGGINTQRLPFISPEQVRDEVLRTIEILGKRGGYICGPDHHIKPDVSVENTLILFETARDFRQEGYTLLV